MIGEGAAEADGVKQVTSGRWVNTVVGALQAWMVPSYVLAQDKVQLVTSYGGGNGNGPRTYQSGMLCEVGSLTHDHSHNPTNNTRQTTLQTRQTSPQLLELNSQRVTDLCENALRY